MDAAAAPRVSRPSRYVPPACCRGPIPGDARAQGDDEPPRPSLDALGDKLRARRAANDFLEVAKKDGLMSDEEADRQRSENEARAAQGDDAAAGETKERYSRFGDWFDVLSK